MIEGHQENSGYAPSTRLHYPVVKPKKDGVGEVCLLGNISVRSAMGTLIAVSLVKSDSAAYRPNNIVPPECSVVIASTRGILASESCEALVDALVRSICVIMAKEPPELLSTISLLIPDWSATD